MLSKLELCAIDALLALNPDRTPVNRDLRALNDWNGTQRMNGGVGIATIRKRNRLTTHNTALHGNMALAHMPHA